MKLKIEIGGTEIRSLVKDYLRQKLPMTRINTFDIDILSRSRYSAELKKACDYRIVVEVDQ